MADSQQSNKSSYGKRPMWQWILLYLVIGGLLYYAVYYFVYAKKGTDMYRTQPVEKTAGQQATTHTQSFTVDGSEFVFMPSTLSVNKGDVVTVTFKNGGNYPHNFSIAELNVKSKTIQPGGSDTVTFTADRVGSFAYNCTVDSHTEKGMKGTLVVQ
jgi:plastocyanin